MQPSHPSAGPQVLRCPHCGAPLDAQPYQLSARCKYCGITVKLADHAPPPAQPPRPGPPSPGSASFTPLLIAVAVLGVVALLGAAAVATFLAARSPGSKSTSAASQPPSPQKPAARGPAPEPPKVPSSARPRAKRYPLAALLGVSADVDIDGSKQHMQELFPGVEAAPRADELSFRVPLEHPWFREATFGWKNERAGKLSSVKLDPPSGSDKFTNQSAIADCLTKGLGKPEVREIDHLAGEMSYFWGKNFPRAWANLYSGYLWMAFRDSKGIPPVTAKQVLKTLDGCKP
jgi:hypothetical protein